MWSIFLPLVGFISLLSYFKHFLSSLISIEFTMLTMFLLMSLFYMSLSKFCLLIFLSLAACEGALGLSILINMARMMGSDLTFLFNIS